jgi:replicative DNA helicase
MKVPVIALSQLSRASEQRGGDKKPMLSDLRESGSIEQDADVVCFIHRDSYYNKDENGDEDPDSKGKAEIIIAKQSNGPTGSVHLAYLSTTRALKTSRPATTATTTSPVTPR